MTKPGRGVAATSLEQDKRRGAGWAIAGLSLIAGLLALYRADERDFWFHLAAGRSILAHGLPRAESWCLAARGQWPWLGEWLFHVALYSARAIGGDVAVGLWRAAWAAGAMAMALRLAAEVGAPLWAAVVVAPLALAIGRERFAARPEQLTLALTSLYALVFERARRGRGDRTAWLIPVSAVWANLHPGWIQGPIVAWVYAVGAARGGAGERRASARGRGAGTEARRWAWVGVAMVAAAALTPRPFDTLTLRVLRDIHADPVRSAIEELRPWSWAADRASPFTALVALALLAVVTSGRRLWRASPGLAMAAALALGAGLASYRFRAPAAFLALPVLAVAFGGARPGALAETLRRRADRLGVTLAALAAAAGLAGLIGDAPKFKPGVAPRLESVPVRAVDVADSLSLPDPTFNTSWYGGYLLWRRGDARPPFEDGRNLGPAALRETIVRSFTDSLALGSLLDQWRFAQAILEPPESPDNIQARVLFHRPGWALVFADDAGLLFARRDVLPAAAVGHAYRLFSPDYGELAAVAERAVADSAVRDSFVAELERARTESPWHSRASFWLGLLALSRHDAARAVALLDETRRIAPLTPGLALRQGMALQMAGDRAGARAAFERALREPDDAAAARRALDALR